MNAIAKHPTPALETRCDAGCGRVATRGSLCAFCAVPCTSCGTFHAAADLKSGTCRDCEVAACEWELEEYASAACTCGSAKPSHVARRTVSR